MSDEWMLESHYSQERNDLDQACSEIDRLRARVAELEAAGDVLAVEASWTSLDVRCGPLDDAVSDWRAVRGTIASGERGEGSE